MKMFKSRIIIAALALLFSTSLLAQLSDQQATALATAAATGGATLDQQIQTILGDNPSDAEVAALATALSGSFNTPAQLTTALASAGVSPAQTTVAVRTAIPSASSEQLAQGLANAGVDTTAAASAITTANQDAPQQAAPPAPAPANIAISAGILVDSTTGLAVQANSEDELLEMVLVHIKNVVIVEGGASNDDFFAVSDNLGSLLTNALASAGVSAENAATTASSILTAVVNADVDVLIEGGELASSILDDAFNNAIVAVLPADEIPDAVKDILVKISGS